ELLELLGYEHASLVAAQKCSGIAASAPLFSTLFNYRHRSNAPASDWTGVPGVQVLARAGTRTGYPITVCVDDFGEDFMITAQTDRRIDPRRVLEFMLEATQSLSGALERAPHTPALALSILPDTERSKVIETFNVARVECSEGQLIHDLFEQQVS